MKGQKNSVLGPGVQNIQNKMHEPTYCYVYIFSVYCSLNTTEERGKFESLSC